MRVYFLALLASSTTSLLAHLGGATAASISEKHDGRTLRLKDPLKKEEDAYWMRFMQETDMSVSTPTTKPPTPPSSIPTPTRPSPTPPPPSSIIIPTPTQPPTLPPSTLIPTGPTQVPCTSRKTYTSNVDFEEGDLINVVSDIADQLQLNNRPQQPYKFIWIAASTRGTILKVDTDTGTILGEFWSGPASAGLGKGNPSRTTVDADGSVWVTNRNHAPGSIVHIGLQENNQCEDRNGNGVIDTSTGLNDTRAWWNESGVRGVATAEDECIVHFTRVNSTGTRHLSIDLNNNIWVSGYGIRSWDLVKGGRYDVPDSGTIIKSYASVNYGGYGGLQDKNGVLWSSRPLLRWDTALPLTPSTQVGNGNPVGPSIGPPINGLNWAGQDGDCYGLCIDSMGNVWCTQLRGNVINKYASDGTFLGGFQHGFFHAQGCVVGQNDDVWVAHSINGGGTTVGHISNNGTFLGVVQLPPGSGPTGVAVDRLGKIWSSNFHTNSISRIDPSLNGGVGGVDLNVTLGVGAGPYNYGDMTGKNLIAPPQSGSWTVEYDSGVVGQEWGRLEWTDSTPSGSTLIVQVSSSADGRTYSPFETAMKSADLSVPNGQYLKIRVLFTRSSTGSNESPVLYDLQILSC